LIFDITYYLFCHSTYLKLRNIFFMYNIIIYLYIIYYNIIKIFHTITLNNYCLTLQKTLDKFISWCNTFNTSLNISKCKVMTFFRSKSMMSFDYWLGGVSIQCVSQVHNLVILFVPSLNFSPHFSL